MNTLEKDLEYDDIRCYEMLIALSKIDFVTRKQMFSKLQQLSAHLGKLENMEEAGIYRDMKVLSQCINIYHQMIDEKLKKTEIEFDYSEFTEIEKKYINDWFSYKKLIKSSYKTQRGLDVLKRRMLQLKAENILITSINFTIDHEYRGIVKSLDGQTSKNNFTYNSKYSEKSFNNVYDFSKERAGPQEW
jgi:hypothetical protein